MVKIDQYFITISTISYSETLESEKVFLEVLLQPFGIKLFKTSLPSLSRHCKISNLGTFFSATMMGIRMKFYNFVIFNQFIFVLKFVKQLF